MSLTVNAAFNSFNQIIVNLDTERTKIARSSRDWLIGQLVNLPNKVADFPLLFDGMHIKYGSFARNTKIRELDDIDLIICLHAQGTQYGNSYSGAYTLVPPSTAKTLLGLCNDDGTLNSIKLVNKFKNALSQIEHYKAAEIHRKQEAVTLSLSSYEWVFDIVPAFHSVHGYYEIPDGSGGWKPTNPEIDQEKVNRINTKHNGRLLQLIRTLKFWNRRAMTTTIPSYLFENMILNYCDNRVAISEYIDFALRDFWSYFINGIHYSVPDPKGFQGELNTLSQEQRDSISAKAQDAYNRAQDAIRFETTDKNQQAAINKWAEIFGPNFN